MPGLVFCLASFALTLLGFIIGIVNILKKKAPFFFALIIFAVGCFLIEQLSLLVNLWCGILDDVWVGALGIFGCNFFLLSANYGALDKLVSDRKIPASKRLLPLIPPVILAAEAVSMFFIWKDSNLLCAVLFGLLSLPAIPASYFNMKHLLLPEDELGLLKATRSCDIMSLVFFLVSIIYTIVEALAPLVWIGIAGIALALSLLGLSLAAAKGVRLWEI